MHQGLDYEVESVIGAAQELNLFPSLCTVQQADTNFGASGAPSGTFVNISGVVNIPCTAAPQSVARILATETKTMTEITAMRPQHVLLQGYYPQVPAGNDLSPRPSLRALIDGEAFEVMGVEHDSWKQMTRLMVRTARI